jgi:hypothetical protein
MTTAALASCRRPVQTSERVLFLTVCRRGVRAGRRLAAGQNARRREGDHGETSATRHANTKKYMLPKDDVDTLPA